MEREIEGCKPEARQSILLQCLNTDDASRPFAIDWHAYDLAFEEAGSMHPLLRHELDLWLKTVWGVLKPFEERLTLDDFKCLLLHLALEPVIRVYFMLSSGTARWRTRGSGRSGCHSARRAA